MSYATDLMQRLDSDEKKQALDRVEPGEYARLHAAVRAESGELPKRSELSDVDKVQFIKKYGHDEYMNLPA